MRVILLAAVLALAGCGEDVETKIAQCRMSPDGQRVGMEVCMSASGYSLVYSEFCTKTASVGAHLPMCYEQRGVIYKAKRFFGIT